MPLPNIPAPTSALNWWERIWKTLRAVRQRALAAQNVSGSRWPLDSHAWASGTIPVGITETGFTASGVSWDNTKDDPWDRIDRAGHEELSIPSNWYLILNSDACDPTQIVKTTIRSVGNSGALTYDNIRDFVTSGQIPSVAFLEGKRWAIINGDYGLWWHERVMEWPNAREWAKGTVRVYHDDSNRPADVTNPTNRSIKDDAGRWRARDLIGKDLLLYATDGDGQLLRRVTVTAADDKTRVISFAPQAWTPDVDQPYVVVRAGGRAYPGRTIPSPLTWYRGLQQGYFTHRPEIPEGGDDYIGSAPQPAATWKRPGLGGGTCDGYVEDAFDRDLWEPFPLDSDDATCSEAKAEKPHSPHYWKTWRNGVQKALEGVSYSFVEKKSYTNQAELPLLNPAEMFHLAGINDFTTTVTSVPGDSSNVINFSSVAFPYTPIEVHFSVRRADGTRAAGFGIATSSTQMTAGLVGAGDLPAPAALFTTAQDAGRTMVLSLGWTAFQRREFQRMFPKTCFVADTTVVDGERVAIDNPPEVNFAETECEGAGIWSRRPASTHYLDARLPMSELLDPKGWMHEQSEAFVTGEYARYAGDNYANPSITGLGGQRMNDASDPQYKYFDRFYVGRHPRDVQLQIDKQRFGRATVGSTTQLTDPKKNWFNPIWYSGGVLREETGTATSGSTTGLTDTSKTAGGANCFWAAVRFAGFTGSYVGFVVEVLMDGEGFDDPDAAVEKRVITSGNATGVTIGWDVPLSQSASGKQYRIREPRYELNRYEGRTLRLWKPDPSDPTATLTATATVRGNDDTTLFFTAIPWAVDETTSYLVDDPVVGTVWKWNGSAWVDPGGNSDASRVGVTAPLKFHRNGLENLPTYVKRYGRLVVRDAFCRKLFDEVNAVLNVLGWTRLDVVWTNNPGTGAEANSRTSLGGNEEDFPNPIRGDTDRDEAATDYWTYMYQVATSGVECPAAYPYDEIAGGACGDGWAARTPFTTTPVVPHVFSHGVQSGGGARMDLERVYGYATVTVAQPSCPIANQIDYYAYATIDADDTPAGGSCYIFGNWREYGFDPGGADGLIYRKYGLWFSESSTTTGENRVSGSLGINQLDDPASMPPEPTPGGCFVDGQARHSYLGYYVQQAYAVVKWEFDDQV